MRITSFRRPSHWPSWIPGHRPALSACMAPDAQCGAGVAVRPRRAEAVHSAHSPARTRRSTEYAARRASPVPPSPRNPVLARFSRRASREPRPRRGRQPRTGPLHTVTPITVTHSDAPRAGARAVEIPLGPSLRHLFLTPSLPFPRDHSTQADRPPRRAFRRSRSRPTSSVRAGVRLASRPVARRPLGALRSKTARASRPSRRAARHARRRPLRRLRRLRHLRPTPLASVASSSPRRRSLRGRETVAIYRARRTVAPGELSAEALYGRVSADNAAKARESVSTSAARGAWREPRWRRSRTADRRSRWRSRRRAAGDSAGDARARKSRTRRRASWIL